MNKSAIIDQTRPDQPNYDLLYDKEYYIKHINTDLFIHKTLTFRTIHDGYIMPYSFSFNEGGIFDSEGKYVLGSSFRAGGYAFKHQESNANFSLSTLADEQNFNLSETVHNHSTVVYLGVMLKVWGHFLTDDMRLLWFLRSKEYREIFSDCKIVYLPALGFEPKGNWLRMLEILGINTSLLTPVTQLARYDKIILPDECFSGGRFTSEYVEIIDHVRDFAQSLSNSSETRRKIYYSCSKISHGKTIGEDKLEKYFASKGYEVIYPEQLSLDEQLKILAECESFASTEGSSSHNSLFLKDNTEVIIIPRANYMTGYQLAINQVHAQNINYIDSSFSIFVGKATWSGPFLYFISSNLRKYFHDENAESIVYASDFWKYLLSSFGLSFNRSFGNTANGNNPDTYRYYSSIAADYLGKLFSSAKNGWLFRLRQFLMKIRHRKFMLKSHSNIKSSSR